MYKVIKRYGHERGLSCAFRQWRAESHCRFLHGYSLAVEICISSSYLNKKNWVTDFGDFAVIKEFLENTFDHKTVVARDDPHLKYFKEMHDKGMIDLLQMNDVGCEKFAEYIYKFTQKTFEPHFLFVDYVKVSEHDSNHAIYSRSE